MFKVGDKVIVKDLETLLKNEDLQQAKDLEDVYVNADKSFVVFSDFMYFDTTTAIDKVDQNDSDMPYFLSCGIWVPEFMIKAKDEPKKEVIEEPVVAEKIWINKFTEKPFGKLFIKLIEIDPKIAEFSNTAFSKLKKHELQYIAKLLLDRGHKAIDYNKATQKELATYCYTETAIL